MELLEQGNSAPPTTLPGAPTTAPDELAAFKNALSAGTSRIEKFRRSERLEDQKR